MDHDQAPTKFGGRALLVAFALGWGLAQAPAAIRYLRDKAPRPRVVLVWPQGEAEPPKPSEPAS